MGADKKPKRKPEFDEDDDYVRLVAPYRASRDNATALVSFKRDVGRTPKAPAVELFYSFEIVARVPAEEH
jgi:hypothetical protein